MEFQVNLYMDPIGVLLNTIDLENAVTCQLGLEEDLDFIYKKIDEFQGLSDVFNTKDEQEIKKNVSLLKKEIELRSIPDLMRFITVSTNDISYYMEDDAIVYIITCNINLYQIWARAVI